MARTIILIDDDPDDLDIIKEALSSMDDKLLCISFIYPDEALRVMLSKELVVIPDLILVDINMPGITGDKVLKSLRNDAFFKDVFIAMYSTSMPETVSDALKLLGANYTFAKPVRVAAYAQILGDVLHQVSLLRK